MANFLDNVVNKNPIPLPINISDTIGKVQGASDLVSGFNIPTMPKIENPLQSLKDKLPSKELADKAAAKYKELQDKFNTLKKTKVSLKKPKPFKPKEIPLPKKFKKAELEKIKGLQGKIGDLKSQATGLVDKAKNAAQTVQSQATNLTSQVKNATQNIQSKIGNLPTQLPKI